MKCKGIKIIETKRLILRPFKLTDVEEFSVICADHEVMQYIGKGAHDKAQTEIRVCQFLCVNDHVNHSTNNLQSSL